MAVIKTKLSGKREKEGAGVTKRDVQKYMRQQQKEARGTGKQSFAHTETELNKEEL